MDKSLINIQDTWETGDIILFHSKHNCFGKFIQYFSKSYYSHVGMILRNPDFTEQPLVGLYFWESSLEDFDDAEDHERKFGVEIVDLQELINRCEDVELYYRKLQLDNYKLLDLSKLKEIHEAVHNKPYDKNILDWIEAFFKVDGRPQKTDRFWCSALMGFIYVKLGLLPEDLDWSMLRPNYFSHENKTLELIDAHLGPEIKIKY